MSDEQKCQAVLEWLEAKSNELWREKDKLFETAFDGDDDSDLSEREDEIGDILATVDEWIAELQGDWQFRYAATPTDKAKVMKRLETWKAKVLA